VNGAVLLALVAASAPNEGETAPTESTAILAAAREGHSWDLVAELADTVGARPAGSPGAEAAVRWAAAWFRRFGFDVRLEPVKVRPWIRGEERAEVLASDQWRSQPLAVAALGNSPPTPPGGVVAEVVEVGSLADLETLGGRVRGKVVLFQHDMKDRSGYGRFASLRTRGPARAASLGAAAALVRSLSTATLRIPHTGTTVFPPGAPRIPAAAVSAEDAELLHRLSARGPVTVRLVLGCRTGDAEVSSANVVAELRGREKPDEIVLVGAHLDSWDLGTGAIDDGAGVAMVMDALRIAKAQGRAPRRTIRAVLFMNEENGLDGAISYYQGHRAEARLHVAAIEADEGAGKPLSVQVASGPGGIELARSWAEPLAAIGASQVGGNADGADISPLAYEGVPFLNVAQEGSRYFDWHHSAADTLDKVDRGDLALATAALAWIAWSAAESEATLPRQPVPGRRPWWLPEPAGPAGAVFPAAKPPVP